MSALGLNTTNYAISEKPEVVRICPVPPKIEKANQLNLEPKISITNLAKCNIVKENISFQETPKEESKPELLTPKMKATSDFFTLGSTVGTIVTVPNEIVKNVPAAVHVTKGIKIAAAVNAISNQNNPLIYSASVGVAKTAAKVENLGKMTIDVSTNLMNSRLLSKVASRDKAELVSGKFLPTLGAVTSGFSIYTNSMRLNKAIKENNTKDKVISTTQIGLNIACGVGGFFVGKGQTISAVTGVASLALEVGSNIYNKKNK